LTTTGIITCTKLQRNEDTTIAFLHFYSVNLSPHSFVRRECNLQSECVSEHKNLNRYITGHFKAESFTQSIALVLKLKATRRQT